MCYRDQLAGSVWDLGIGVGTRLMHVIVINLRVPFHWDLCIGVGTRSCLDSPIEILGHSLKFFWLD